MQSVINREARSKYEFLETWDAGLVLTGAEVKSVKHGRMNLKGSYISEEKGELWLKKVHISAYQLPNQPDYEPERSRKLLLKRKEIDSILGKLKQNGLTLIPKKVYSKSGLIKVEVALARGLKKHDKRARLKERDVNRSIRRALRQK